MLPVALFVWVLMQMTAVSSGRQAEALYHTSVNFTCDNPTAFVTVRRLWILPNDDLITPGMTGGTGNERVQLLDSGAVLHVPDVDDEDFGWYYCLIHLQYEDRYLMQKHGLNVQGPFWGDLYDLKYKGMLTTGLVAGAICFVLTGILCFLYGRQQTRLEQAAEEEKERERRDVETGKPPEPQSQGKSDAANSAGQDNPAFKHSEGDTLPMTDLAQTSAETSAAGSADGVNVRL